MDFQERCLTDRESNSMFEGPSKWDREIPTNTNLFLLFQNKRYELKEKKKKKRILNQNNNQRVQLANVQVLLFLPSSGLCLPLGFFFPQKLNQKRFGCGGKIRMEVAGRLVVVKEKLEGVAGLLVVVQAKFECRFPVVSLLWRRNSKGLWVFSLLSSRILHAGFGVSLSRRILHASFGVSKASPRRTFAENSLFCRSFHFVVGCFFVFKNLGGWEHRGEEGKRRKRGKEEEWQDKKWMMRNKRGAPFWQETRYLKRYRWSKDLTTFRTSQKRRYSVTVFSFVLCFVCVLNFTVWVSCFFFVIVFWTTHQREREREMEEEEATNKRDPWPTEFFDCYSGIILFFSFLCVFVFSLFDWWPKYFPFFSLQNSFILFLFEKRRNKFVFVGVSLSFLLVSSRGELLK